MISVIVPFYNEEANVAVLYTQLSRVLDTVGEEWELVYVNDGSRDNTLAELLALQQRGSRIRVIELSRRFGKEAALTAGLDYARGEVAILRDADLQDPPEVIPLAPKVA
jgi:glycosyltransferase involved in cell wall biosynthesis